MAPLAGGTPRTQPMPVAVLNSCRRLPFVIGYHTNVRAYADSDLAAQNGSIPVPGRGVWHKAVWGLTQESVGSDTKKSRLPFAKIRCQQTIFSERTANLIYSYRHSTHARCVNSSLNKG